MAALYLFVVSSAFYPAPAFVQPPAAAPYGVAALRGSGLVVMNTKYGDPAVLAYRKKNPATGSSNGLKGYRVGSRAPPRAVSSGTIAQYGYGIDNLYGGKRTVVAAKSAAAGTSNSLLGGAGASLNKSALTASGLGPIFCWVGIIILVGSYFKFGA